MELFDILIPIGPRDYKEIVDIMIEHTKKNILGYRNIYIVAYDSTIEYEGCMTINENIFPFNKELIDTMIGPTNRLGWYLQQLIKLYAGITIPGILNTYLVIDVDTIFMKPTAFFNEEGKPLYNTGDEYHPAYFNHMYYMLPSLTKVTQPSGICHHMVFQTHILREMFEKVETHNNGEPFYHVFLKCIEPYHATGAGASEYEIYFSYLHIYHSGEFVIRPLRWKNANFFQLEEDYDYISYHWYCLG
jgi:hypothetical protein